MGVEKKRIKNLLCNEEVVLNILLKEYPKINYWGTLKIPQRLGLGVLDIDYIKTNFFEVYCNLLIKNNIVKFIIGFIEENTWEKGYYHAHILIESVKNEHNFFFSWANVLIDNCNQKNLEFWIKFDEFLYKRNIKNNLI